MRGEGRELRVEKIYPLDPKPYPLALEESACIC